MNAFPVTTACLVASELDALRGNLALAKRGTTFAGDPSRIKRDFTPAERAENGRKGGRKGGPIAGNNRTRSAHVRALGAFQRALLDVRLELSSAQLAEVRRLAVLLEFGAYERGYKCGHLAAKRGTRRKAPRSPFCGAA